MPRRSGRTNKQNGNGSNVLNSNGQREKINDNTVTVEQNANEIAFVDKNVEQNAVFVNNTNEGPMQNRSRSRKKLKSTSPRENAPTVPRRSGRTNKKNGYDPHLLNIKSTEGLDDVPTVQRTIINDNTAAVEQNVNEIEVAKRNIAIPKQKRSRHRKQVKSSWPREVTKTNREHGKAYQGYQRTEEGLIHGIDRPERQLGLRCSSDYCLKSSKRNCDDVDEEKRIELFNRFWNDLSWDQKKIYVASLVDVDDTERKNVDESRRSVSLKYFLKFGSKRMQVCKQFFMSSLGLNEWMIRNWATNNDDGIIPAKTIINARRKVERTPSEKSLADKVKKDYLLKFFDDQPKMPSHYCRKRTDKKYLEPNFQSLAQLYRYYQLLCNESNTASLSYGYFCELFKDEKLGLYQPKNDRCDTCEGFDKGNVTAEEYNEHVKQKDRARKEKNNDKEKAIAGECHTFVWDVQAVKLCPANKSGILYYKSKLKVHNFSIYNLRTTDCMNNWWSENDGGMDSSMFITCVIDYFLANCNDNLPIIVWSDGCGYQNRNQILSNALLDYAIRHNKIVQQKFLIKGHTQMEVDNVHALIENKLKGRNIDLPVDYIKVTNEARLTLPLKARLLNYKDFRNYDDSRIFRYNSVRPGKNTGDDTVTDLRMLNYSPTGTISFKVDFDDVLKPLPRNPKEPTLSYEILDPFYIEELKISAKRYSDLQDLKIVLPLKSHSFYDNLKHEG